MNGNRLYLILGLCFLGLSIGTFSAWRDVSQELGGANALANLEPAAGSNENVVAGTQIGSGSFTLTDHHGNRVNNQTYQGQYKLVFFGFTHCPDICPAGLQKMANVMNGLNEKSDNIQPLFVTVDPMRDTPEVMEVYLSQYHDKLIGLTGSDDELRTVMNDFRVYAAKVEDPQGIHEYTMDHSSFIFFMGPDDEFLGLYGSDDAPSDIIADINKTLRAS